MNPENFCQYSSAEDIKSCYNIYNYNYNFDKISTCLDNETKNIQMKSVLIKLLSITLEPSEIQLIKNQKKKYKKYANSKHSDMASIHSPI